MVVLYKVFRLNCVFFLIKFCQIYNTHECGKWKQIMMKWKTNIFTLFLEWLLMDISRFLSISLKYISYFINCDAILSCPLVFKCLNKWYQIATQVCSFSKTGFLHKDCWLWIWLILHCTYYWLLAKWKMGSFVFLRGKRLSKRVSPCALEALNPPEAS